jgi:type I site-specific restriction endonuclease
VSRKQSKIIRDPIRKQFLIDGPEERVRQGVIQFLVRVQGIPEGLISTEKEVAGGTRTYRFDIVVFDSEGQPWMVIECKAPNISVGQRGFDQLGRYNYHLKAPFMMLTNGVDHYCCSASRNTSDIKFLESFPAYPSKDTST